MLPNLVYRTLRSANPRCIAKFAWNFGVEGSPLIVAFADGVKASLWAAKAPLQSSESPRTLLP